MHGISRKCNQEEPFILLKHLHSGEIKGQKTLTSPRGNKMQWDFKKCIRVRPFVFLPAAKPSRSRSEESPPGEKSRIEYLGDLILTVSMVIGPTKFIGDLKLDPRSYSGPSRGATRATSLW